MIAPDGNNGDPIVAPAAAALSFALFHSRRFLLGCPRPGSDDCDQVLVWDSRAPNPSGQGGWFQFLPPVAMTSAVSMGSATDSDVSFWGGADGQLYALQGSYDQATPTASHEGIPFTLTSRTYGQSDGLEWYSTNIPTRLFFDVTPGEALQMTFSVIGQAAYTATYTLAAGVNNRPTNRIARYAAGKVLNVSFSGSPVTPFRLSNFYLETAEGNTR